MNFPPGKKEEIHCLFLLFTFPACLLHSHPSSKDKSEKPQESHCYEDNYELAESLQCLLFKFLSVDS